MSVKLEGADESRCPPVPNKTKSPLCCAGCGVGDTVLDVCTGCRSAHYCGKKCQKSHWKQHRTVCQTIQQLIKERDELIELKCSFVSHVTPKLRQKIVELVGEKCMIECMIEGEKVESLWDTGAQVSLVDRELLSKLGNGVEIKPLSDLVGNGNGISLSGADGTKIPYLGYVWLPVLLKGQSDEIKVPFLVTATSLSNPIIGYNVIKAVAGKEESENIKFFKGVSDVAVSEVMALLADPEVDHLADVKMTKSGDVVKRNSSTMVSVKQCPCGETHSSDV